MFIIVPRVKRFFKCPFYVLYCLLYVVTNTPTPFVTLVNKA
nr:MAG TPA: hypothetical protein [Caudoviricetes sp.]